MARGENGGQKIMLSLTKQERADVDAVRGTIPAATWCRDAVVKVVAEAKRVRS